MILLSLLPDNSYLRRVEPVPWRLDPLNGTTGLTYDAKGNLLNVTDARRPTDEGREQSSASHRCQAADFTECTAVENRIIRLAAFIASQFLLGVSRTEFCLP